MHLQVSTCLAFAKFLRGYEGTVDGETKTVSSFHEIDFWAENVIVEINIVSTIDKAERTFYQAPTTQYHSTIDRRPEHTARNTKPRLTSLEQNATLPLAWPDFCESEEKGDRLTNSPNCASSKVDLDLESSAWQSPATLKQRERLNEA
ncbi:hypothetical protein ElyMa_000963200 [Elysia marginata]|uniref:Uncharacterized protein n=1 Tax=Elysia marginata TaxID=1093978 RepID=A0AAV4HFP0_9GAST|nr:hypothetical protein ElyMa_000963200 [Elysia marginata]